MTKIKKTSFTLNLQQFKQLIEERATEGLLSKVGSSKIFLWTDKQRLLNTFDLLESIGVLTIKGFTYNNSKNFWITDIKQAK